MVPQCTDLPSLLIAAVFSKLLPIVPNPCYINFHPPSCPETSTLASSLLFVHANSLLRCHFLVLDTNAHTQSPFSSRMMATECTCLHLNVRSMLALWVIA